MRAIVATCGLMLAGCTEASIGQVRCQDVEADVVALSKGRVIKIVGARETSRTIEQLTCHGTALLQEGGTPEMRYRAWKDEDGEIMVSWDTDEASEAAWQQQKKEALREDAEAQRRFDAQIDSLDEQGE